MPGDPDAIDPVWFAPWLSLVEGPSRREHAVLADGRNRIRLDVIDGSLRQGPVVLHYRLAGTNSLRPRMLPLRRLLALCSQKRFVSSLFPPDPRMERFTSVLRVHDAIEAGASIADMEQAFFGAERAAHDSERGSDSLKSRIRRLVREARTMAAGEYRSLLRKNES